MPFTYPKSPHFRIHGPGGYSHYKSYRPWLRDEFRYRCAYCLKREQWGLARGTYDIDHFLPQAHHNDKREKYDNLVYSCVTCNRAKGDQAIPDPCIHMIGTGLELAEDGQITGLTEESIEIIEKLGLDDEEYREFRLLLIGIVQLARVRKPDLYEILMKYPGNLPDLKCLRPPKNSRPKGIERSCYELRRRGELPTTY